MSAPTTDALPLDGASLTLADFEDVTRRRRAVALAPAQRAPVEASRRLVERIVEEGRVVYGITTGFGNFAEVTVDHDHFSELQVNLVRSHAAGVGEPLGEPETRGLMLLRAATLARGTSGVRLETLESLLALLNAGVHPVIPSQGSVGASGDLAPLAHLALALIGEGQCRYEGRVLPAAEALAAAGIAPVTLAPKEGLTLINGTQMMTAVTGLALAEALRLAKTADVAAALSLDALKGTDAAFDPRIHAARPHPGQVASARNMARLLEGSAIRESHRSCGRVQDAYSLRCAPQVHGACRDALAYVERTLAVEMNASTDNPLVFVDHGDVISGGNFHGQPVALAADTLAIAVAELASISERRIERLVNPTLSELPAFLTPQGGLQSGLMIAQVTAASLVSENKVLAHPASVDSIPTSANKEDHVSMGATAARKAARVVENVRRVLAIELIAACQALEFLKPLEPSPPLEAVHRAIRERVPAYDTDRHLAPELEAVAEMVADGSVLRIAEAECGRLE